MNTALSRRLSFYTVLIATAVFAVAMSVVYFYARNKMIDKAKQDAQKEIEHAAMLICNRLDATEIAIDPQGVLTADISLNKDIASIVRNYDRDNLGKTYLLGPRKQLLFGDTTFVTKDNILFESNLKDTEWVLGHIISRDVLLRPLRAVMFNIMLLFIFTILVIYLSISYTIRRISKPEIQKQLRLDAELNIAHVIQQGMLPKKNPPFPERNDIDVKAVMQPAKEVGGDFYNYFLKGDLLYFVIADVSGKGVPAAIVMAIATELFLISSPDETDASKIVEKINQQINRDNKSAMFITMIAGILDVKKGEMQLCNAGHNPPYLIVKDKVNSLDLPKNVPVGLFSGFTYQTEKVSFGKGTKLVLYTDGVTEAENAAKEQFGDMRLRNILADNPADICTAVAESVHAFADGYEQSDDITLMTVELI